MGHDSVRSHRSLRHGSEVVDTKVGFTMLVLILIYEYYSPVQVGGSMAGTALETAFGENSLCYVP